MSKARPKPRGRPPKEPSQRRDADLRIPVTQDEKAVIKLAVDLTERAELASWARETLLQAARAKIAGAAKKR